MAIKNQAPEADSAPELFTPGELRAIKNISWPVFSGMCSAENWRPGKQISEKEFDVAVARFAGAPIKGNESGVK